MGALPTNNPHPQLQMCPHPSRIICQLTCQSLPKLKSEATLKTLPLPHGKYNEMKARC